jgi:hypothetical protein
VAGTFQLLQERLDIVIVLPGSHSGKQRLHDKGLRFSPSVATGQTKAQQPIDRSFERIPGALGLMFQEDGNVVVDGECGSHIMMLLLKAS